MGQRLDAGVLLGHHGGWGLGTLSPPEVFVDFWNGTYGAIQG